MSDWDFQREAAEMPWGQDFDNWHSTRPQYDVQSGHQLGYDPGQHPEGKGFILSDGSVWTWPTFEMRPQHLEYSKRVTEAGGTVQPGSAFHIKDGMVYTYGPGREMTPELGEQITAADPRLSVLDDTADIDIPNVPGYGHGRNVLDILGGLTCMSTRRVGDREICNDCGRTTSFLKFAFNPKKLKREKYFQEPQGRAVLEMLERRYPRDPRVLNWLLREYRRGRLVVSPQWQEHVQMLMQGEQVGDEHLVNRANQLLDDPNRPDVVLWHPRDGQPPHPVPGQAPPDPVQPGIVPIIGEIMDKGHKGKGLDIMQYRYPQLLPLVDDYLDNRKNRDPEFGEVVHAFPDGWTVRRIQTPEETMADGYEVQNCLPKFAPSVPSDEWHLFSLRDHRNAPHANALISPRQQGGHWEGGILRDVRGKQNEAPRPEIQERFRQWFDHFNEKPSVRWDPFPAAKDPGGPEPYGLEYHPSYYQAGPYPQGEFWPVNEEPQHLGSRLAWVFVSDRMDFLQDPEKRPDLQTPEAQAFLNALRAYHSDKNDVMMPFLVKEWKQGRIKHDGYTGLTILPSEEMTPEQQATWQETYNRWEAAGYGEEYARTRADRAVRQPHVVTVKELNEMGEWMKSNHPSSKGINLNAKDVTFHDLEGRYKEYEEHLRRKRDKEDLVHKNESGHYIKTLRPDECRWEGTQMKNCISGSGYDDKIRRGASILYSLRDKNGNPHVDIEIQPKWAINKQTKEKKQINELPYGWQNTDEWVPVPQEGGVIQIQGKQNAPPPEPYQPLVAEWFNSKHFIGQDGEDWRPQWHLPNGSHFTSMDQLWTPPPGQHVCYYHPGDYGLVDPGVTTDYMSMVKTITNDHRTDPEGKRLKHLVGWAKHHGELDKLHEAVNHPQTVNHLMQQVNPYFRPQEDEEYNNWVEANPRPQDPRYEPFQPTVDHRQGFATHAECGSDNVQLNDYGEGHHYCGHCWRDFYDDQLAGPDGEEFDREAWANAREQYDNEYEEYQRGVNERNEQYREALGQWRTQEAEVQSAARARAGEEAWNNPETAERASFDLLNHHLTRAMEAAQAQAQGAVRASTWATGCVCYDCDADWHFTSSWIRESNWNKVRNMLRKNDQFEGKNRLLWEGLSKKFPNHADLAEWLHREGRKGRLGLTTNGTDIDHLTTRLETLLRDAEAYRGYAQDEGLGQADRDYYMRNAENYQEQADNIQQQINEFFDNTDINPANVQFTIPGLRIGMDGQTQPLTEEHLDAIRDIMRTRAQRWKNATPEQKKEWEEADEHVKQAWRDNWRQRQEWEKEDRNDREPWPEDKQYSKLDQHNIMKVELPSLAKDIQDKAIEAQGLKTGRVVHEYDDGYTLRYVDSDEAADNESAQLGHCIQRYKQQIADGSSLNYSLRDKQGKSRLTFEIKPKGPPIVDWEDIEGHVNNLNAPAICPECGGELDETATCQNCGHKVDVNDQYTDYTPEEIEHFKRIHDDRQSAAEEGRAFDQYAHDPNVYAKYTRFLKNAQRAGHMMPDPRRGSTYQIQGKSGTTVSPKYHKYVKEWAETIPYDERPVSQWTNYQTPVGHISNIENYVNKVDDLGFQAPNRSINWDNIINTLDGQEPKHDRYGRPQQVTPAGAYKPEMGQQLFDVAQKNGMLMDVYRAMNKFDNPGRGRGRRGGLACPNCGRSDETRIDYYGANEHYCGWCGHQWVQQAPQINPNGPNYTPYQAAMVQHLGPMLAEVPEIQTMGMHGADDIVNFACSKCGGKIVQCQTCPAPDHGQCEACGNIAYYDGRQAKVANLINHQQPHKHVGHHGTDCHCLWHEVNHHLWEQSPHRLHHLSQSTKLRPDIPCPHCGPGQVKAYPEMDQVFCQGCGWAQTVAGDDTLRGRLDWEDYNSPDALEPNTLDLGEPRFGTVIPCHACGDPMENGACKRCDWGDWNVVDGDPTKNPKDPVKDLKGPVQSSFSSVVPVDRWSWSASSADESPTTA